MNVHTLISFATQWGSKYGGINCFNTDFLHHFGIAYNLGAQLVCVVTSTTPEEIEEARNAYVTLLPLPYSPADKLLAEAHAQVAIDELQRRGITFEPDNTVWLGHDRITGAAAIAAAKQAGGRSALIHHMSYDHYESYAEDSATARTKVEEQTALFRQADIVLAIGPLLRDALTDMLGSSKPVHMLVPGLAEIPPRDVPKTFTAFISGRLSDDAVRIKQGHLGIAAFAQAHREACDHGMPDGLCKHPKLVLRGVDFEVQTPTIPSESCTDPETELKRFAQDYAQCVINLQALPYTHDRETLYADMSGASVAMMPSWHEGFGLVAWEAIAAGVPLIISENSGVYRLLEEEYPGSGTGCVYAVSVRGAVDSPFFRQEDLQSVMSKLIEIANKPGEAKRKAGALRSILGSFTWPNCAEQAVQAFGWTLQKGSLPPVTPEQIASVLNTPTPPSQPTVTISSPLQTPIRQWKAGSGMADSQLLRAEEALVPFDPARRTELDSLNSWLDDQQWPHAVRLITGAGGLGKTRLALELCQQRTVTGWHTGFLDAQLDQREMTAAWQQLRAFGMPVLVVIDYAETRQPVLLALIKAIVQNPGNHPVRILLLARDGGEWWDNLPSKDPHCEALLSGYATTGPYTLPPLHAEEDGRRHAYRQALTAFADALGVNAPDVTPELAGDHFGRPLYLQMAALLALYGERPTTAEGLTKALLNHERRYWNRLLAHFTIGEPEQHAQQLLALTTLAGGFATPKDAQVYWNKMGASALSPADFNSLFKALVPLYPGKQGLQAVRPDLLGEALVAQALVCSDSARLLDAVLSSGSLQTIRCHALTVLARLMGQRPDLHRTSADALARNFPHCYREILTVIIETSGELSFVAETAFAQLEPTAKSQVAGLLDPQLRVESVQLAGLSCLVDKYLVLKAHQRFQKKQHTDNQAHLAGMLLNHSVSLCWAGRDGQALDCARESFQYFQQLHDVSPDRYASDYALSLSIYATCLSAAGQSIDALEFAQQALKIRKQLAKKNQDRYEPDYADSLDNCATLFGETGKYDLALDLARQALEIYKRLAQKRPDRFEITYAMFLNNFAVSLNDAGQDEEAFEHVNQALEIYKRLVENRPDRFEPNYAVFLNNLAGFLSDLGQSEQVLTHYYQSLEIRQRLAQKNPDRFEPDYAASLYNYAIALSDAGQTEVALSHAIKALQINTKLALKVPIRFTETQFECYCLVTFLRWLLDYSINNGDLVSITSIPTIIPFHRRQHLQLYCTFVHACCSMVPAVREESMKQVVCLWDQLSYANKLSVQPNWLCATTWCTKYSTNAVEHLNWKANWQKFAKQRKGRIPHWMQEVARRLEFQWPDWTAQSDESKTVVVGEP
ncbi:MAG: tetratricopeptide repeat protein [Geobacteraceae bacterium]|nr:tetratricopeptide repeat protein [Geobacteraceae bacterium]